MPASPPLVSLPLTPLHGQERTGAEPRAILRGCGHGGEVSSGAAAGPAAKSEEGKARAGLRKAKRVRALKAAEAPPGCPAGSGLRATTPTPHPGLPASPSLSPGRGSLGSQPKDGRAGGAWSGASASSGQPRATPAGARGSSGEHAQSLPEPGGGGSATAGGEAGTGGAAAGRMEPPPPPPPANQAGAGPVARARRGARTGAGTEEKAGRPETAVAASSPGRGTGAAPRGQAGRRGGGGAGGGGSAQEPPRQGKDPAGGVAPAIPPRSRPRPRRSARSVTVDSSKARTSLEALKLSLRELRWKEFPFGRRLPCDIYWHAVSFHDNVIYSGQVNKFPGMTEMARKVNLSRAMRTMQELFPEEYNFYPRSWILPEEFTIFLTEVNLMKENNPRWKPTFIVKPDGGCQGDGIYLVKDPMEIRLMGNLQSRPAVVQEYMAKPFLIDKLKFDIRLYVLLRSLDPLEVHVAKDGLCRFCTEPYQEPALKNLHQVYMHLTNYSLNIHSGNFVHSDSGNTGSKRTFSSILGKLACGGVDIRKVWSDIISLVIKTVIAIVPELKVFHQSDIPTGKPGPSCFQILGFDILLMKNLKPILLEVNANPSMKIEHEQQVSPGVTHNIPSPVDEEVKVAVIRDTLRLVDPHKKKKKQKHHEQPDKEGFFEEELENKPELGESPPPEAEPPTICLKEVLPKYAKQFSYLRLVERIAALFIRFLGVKGTTKLGPTGFRMFIRNSKISNSGFSMAAGDILYIDITRRGMGMSLQAFVEAVCFLAQRRYKSLSLHEQVELLLDFCEYNLAVLDEKRLACSRSLSGTQATLVTCPQGRLQLSPATPDQPVPSASCISPSNPAAQTPLPMSPKGSKKIRSRFRGSKKAF
uniref:Tubulin tyrosine ligase like 11 n=1 Tax=Naja naja TaxID=35670 RepID=A0A8C7E5T8_NAJNA